MSIDKETKREGSVHLEDKRCIVRRGTRVLVVKYISFSILSPVGRQRRTIGLERKSSSTIKSILKHNGMGRKNKGGGSGGESRAKL
jgi:hypothetical protein